MRPLCTYVAVTRCQYPTIRVKSSRGALKVIVVSQVRPSATILLLSVLLLLLILFLVVSVYLVVPSLLVGL